MEHLLDFQITKVYEAKDKEGSFIEGEGEYGAWKLYTFYTDKTDKDKFTFIWGRKKPIPKQGMNIKHMEYEKEKKGEYTNLNVKKMELGEDKPEPESKAISSPLQPKSNGGLNASFIGRWCADIWTTFVNNGDMPTKEQYEDVVKMVADGTMLFKERIDNPTQELPESPQVSEKESPVEDQPETILDIKDKLKPYYKANKKVYSEWLNIHGAKTADEVEKFSIDAQQAILDDLAKNITLVSVEDDNF